MSGETERCQGDIQQRPSGVGDQVGVLQRRRLETLLVDGIAEGSNQVDGSVGRLSCLCVGQSHKSGQSGPRCCCSETTSGRKAGSLSTVSVTPRVRSVLVVRRPLSGSLLVHGGAPKTEWSRGSW